MNKRFGLILVVFLAISIIFAPVSAQENTPPDCAKLVTNFSIQLVQFTLLVNAQGGITNVSQVLNDFDLTMLPNTTKEDYTYCGITTFDFNPNLIEGLIKDRSPITIEDLETDNSGIQVLYCDESQAFIDIGKGDYFALIRSSAVEFYWFKENNLNWQVLKWHLGSDDHWSFVPLDVVGEIDIISLDFDVSNGVLRARCINTN